MAPPTSAPSSRLGAPQHAWIAPASLYSSTTSSRHAASPYHPSLASLTPLRLFGTTARRFDHTPVSTLPPTSSVKGATAAAAARGASAAATTTTANLRGWSAVKARPLVHASTFLALHVTVAWALVPPIYAFFRSTNTANALLAGPSVSYILAKPIPTWLPASLRGQSPSSSSSSASDAPDPTNNQVQTVEDLLELQVRQFVKLLWKGGVGVYSTVNRFKAKDQHEGGEGDVTKGLARSAIAFLRGKAKGTDSDADTTLQQYDEQHEQSRRPGWAKGYFGEQARKNAGDIKLGQIRDAVAAYVVVKTLLPLRVPLSLFLTPKVVRLFGRAFRRA
ncbi:uncharacterized protein PFL1_03156 [Pseudozyma flocculosa PF-1]|uniref:Uncharacterized protein n=2 Tax=Pseudozyma flocculosa TaxID=84751 RepID=A0A5C3F083_9BASI|nr:uncharacterized protein PFL1_03156 [Pseudozyma flocculosa PF-1]EPQ29401.1 hypothetical protein PFL1_03156 [Pseudozyma flocculosa PF-1]SPO37923.1 uncharacterized protein PSFLO_03400 [Pseudozyma flocculosa]